MKLILSTIALLTLISCSSPAELSESDINQALYYKVANLNSFGSELQDTMSIVKIKRLGEFGLTRIKRFHRRYDFEVQIRFNQKCYQLGHVCLKQRVFNTVNNPDVFVKRDKNETVTQNYFISFVKTKEGWKVVDENIQWPKKPELSK